MKVKIVSAFIVCAMTLGLVACAAEPSSTQSAIEHSAPEKTNLHMVTTRDQVGISSTDSGYYTTEMNNDGSFTICYIDYATKSKIVLCNRPECSHNDETCPAYLNRGVSLFVCDETLYFYFPEMITAKGGAENSDNWPRLECANLNGSNRRILRQFNANSQIVYGIASDGVNLYYCELTTTAFNQEIKSEYWLVSQNINSGAVTKIKELSENKRIIDASDNKFYFKTFENTDTADLFAQKQVISCSELINGKLTEEVPCANWMRDEAVGDVADNDLYLYKYQTDSITKTDLATGEETLLIEGVFNDTVIGAEIERVSNHYLVMTAYQKDDLSTPLQFVIDIDTGSKNENFLFFNSFEGRTTPWQIKAVVKDDFLVVNSMIPQKVTLMYYDQPMEMVIGIEQYALISQDSYYNNLAEKAINIESFQKN